MRKICPFVLAIAAICASSALASVIQRPLPVSPGERDSFPVVVDHCPTFLWTTVSGAESVEISVFELDSANESSLKLLYRKNLPGSAPGWTPSSEDCLRPDHRYAWSLRARSNDRWSPSSEPSLFSIQREHGKLEMSEALRLVRDLIGQEDTGMDSDLRLLLDSLRAASVNHVETEARTGAGSAQGAIGGSDFSIDNDGNVAGASFSGDGSGLTGVDASSVGGLDSDAVRDWDNLLGVPAGFEDGTDDFITYFAGQQLSLVSNTFHLLQGSGSGLDADLLDGQHAGFFAAQASTYSKTEVDGLLSVGNIDAPIPGEPTHLRLGPEPLDPQLRRLSWNLDSSSGVTSFIVYQSDQPITDGNKLLARQQLTGNFHAAVQLLPNSGTQHFRVSGQNMLGEAGPLSNPLSIDTTSRIAYAADYDTQFVSDIFTVPAPPTVPKTQVSAPLIELSAWDWSPDGTRFAYASSQGTYYGLHVIPAAGGVPTRIDDPSLGFLWGWTWSWSPDSSRIAYRSDPSGPALGYQLWVVPPSGGTPVRVNDITTTTVGEFPRPSWSPDGTRLLYAGRKTSGPFSLFAAASTGGSEIELTDPLPPGASGVSMARWSPDGSKVAFTVDSVTPDEYDLYVVPAAGGTAIQINPPLTAGGTVARFEWSPDGSRIAYVGYVDSATVGELYVASASGGPSIKLNEPLVTGGNVSQVAWSPDGSLILFRADLTVDDRDELRVVPAAGGASVRVSPIDADNGGLPLSSRCSRCWAPDGHHLAFFASTDLSHPDISELYVVSPDGSALRKMSDPLAANETVDAVSWSPDSSRLLYRTRRYSDDLRELHLVGINGGNAIKVNDAFTAGRQGILGFQWSPLGN